jgi:hypothetical protein
MMEVKFGLMSQILGKKKILLSKFHGFILIAVIPKKKNKKTQTRSSLRSLRFRNLVVHRFRHEHPGRVEKFMVNRCNKEKPQTNTEKLTRSAIKSFQKNLSPKKQDKTGFEHVNFHR